MESDQKQTRIRWFAILLSLMLLLPLLMSALPQTEAFAVTCKFKYTVESGDTITYVGNLYQIDWTEIADANNLSAPYALAVGQVLCIPGGTKPDGIGTVVPNSNNNNSSNTKKGKTTATMEVASQMNQLLVSVENFAGRTPYYVRLHSSRTGISYRIGNFTTNKEGDWTGWFRVPTYVPRYPDMTVCVKNTWTDKVSCVKYKDEIYSVPAALRTRCPKEGR